MKNNDKMSLLILLFLMQIIVLTIEICTTFYVENIIEILFHQIPVEIMIKDSDHCSIRDYCLLSEFDYTKLIKYYFDTQIII